MQLSFSTLGCPTWDLDTIAARGRDFGFDGIDLRGADCRLFLERVPDPAFGILWDMGHTTRVGGETPGQGRLPLAEAIFPGFLRWIRPLLS